MAPGIAAEVPSPLQIQITSTEERSSMLKSWSVYLLEVDDFGRKFTLEKRFDDFNQLHSDLREVEPGMPPLPEKKFMASTDASVVAERKPAFERILRYLLRSEVAVHEKAQTLFKFLELPPAAVVAFRYLFKTQRVAFARQCGKLTDPKWEKDSYRLSHPAVLRTSLRLLEEGALKEAEPEVQGEAEVAVVEMLRFALGSGNETTRQFFLQEKGVGVLLRYIFRKGKKDPSAGPDQRARGVLNALIKVEGEHFPAVMADFLQKGGVSALQEGTELLRHPGFADFISKLLWIAWDVQVQQVFFAESSRPEALALLSQLFVCPSKGARVCAGLLLANALCHDQLGAERNAAQAAEGLRQLTEEMASLGSWESQEPEDVEVRNLVQGLGQNAERFGRILTCAQAPWEQNQGQLPDEGSPLWPGATFSLWCLLRMKPDPSRLSQLRPALPAVAQGAPPRARWLAGELLLQLQLQVPSQLDSKMDAIVETSIQERTALELSLQEMFEHTRRSLQSELGESSQVIETQQRLLELRQQPLPMATGSSVAGSGWHQPLEAALAKLQTAREELSRALTDAARQRETAQSAVHDVLEMELTTDSAEDQQMDQQLQCMRQTEAEYTARHSEQEQQSSLLKSQEEEVATANTAMEAADKVLQEMRSRIAGYEADISSRQREESPPCQPS
ncbi:PX domain-containing protein [Durusdinium trenchii]|uniref:PX domain-containing protein n=1 Tax=Durusdinium trenchii TaxID=1381693 RepID=A0ABP0L5G4_9DINO